jgi:hypothetical protein
MGIPYQGRKAQRAILLTPPPSKEDEKKHTTAPAPFYPGILFIQGRLESSPISDDEPTMLGDGETGAEMCDNITKPENGTQYNPFLGTKPLRWGRPPTKEHIENSATLAAVTVRLMNESGN